MCCCEDDEYEPDWQPVPGEPGWRYDANLGEWHEGRSRVTGIPLVAWRKLMSRPEGNQDSPS